MKEKQKNFFKYQHIVDVVKLFNNDDIINKYNKKSHINIKIWFCELFLRQRRGELTFSFLFFIEISFEKERFFLFFGSVFIVLYCFFVVAFFSLVNCTQMYQFFLVCSLLMKIFKTSSLTHLFVKLYIFYAYSLFMIFFINTCKLETLLKCLLKSVRISYGR